MRLDGVVAFARVEFCSSVTALPPHGASLSVAYTSANNFGGGTVAAHDLPVVLEVVVHVVEVGELVHLLLDVQKQQTLDPAQWPITPPVQDRRLDTGVRVLTFCCSRSACGSRAEMISRFEQKHRGRGSVLHFRWQLRHEIQWRRARLSQQCSVRQECPKNQNTC